MKNYTFQVDWLSDKLPAWDKYLKPLAGKPHLQFLEIGSFEGRSSVWFLENVLTHSTSQLTCLDTFEGSPEHLGKEFSLDTIESHFFHNLQETGQAKQVMTIKSCSLKGLLYLHEEGYPHEFDCIYIDGSHAAVDVLRDAVFSDLLLKPGGILIFDDYDWIEGTHEWDRPKTAIDAFLQVYQGKYEVLHRNELQVFLWRKP